MVAVRDFSSKKDELNSWRGLQAIFGWKHPPMLELVNLRCESIAVAGDFLQRGHPLFEEVYGCAATNECGIVHQFLM